MLLALGLAIETLRPVEFAPDPPLHEVRRGARLFQQGVGIDRTLAEDRVPVGWWFDGRVKRATEHVVWVSPGLVARRLGYLEAKERWPAGELSRRWRALRGSLNGRLQYLVELSALPRQDPLELGWRRGPGLDEIEQVRFLIEGTLIHHVSVFSSEPADQAHQNSPIWHREPVALAPEVRGVGAFQRSSWRDLPQVDWARCLPSGGLLLSEFEPVEVYQDAGWRGDAHARWLWLVAPIPEGLDVSQPVTLRILSRRKERMARF